MFLMILARLALLPAAAAAATAGLAGLSSFLTTAGDETEDDIALFLFTARGVVVTSTELWAVALVAASLWRPLVITDAGERDSAERELRERSTRVSTGFRNGCCCNCFLGDEDGCCCCCCCGLAEVDDLWVGGRRRGSDLRLFLCDNGFTAVGGVSLANRTHELLVERVVASSFSTLGWWFSESLPYPVAAGGGGGAPRGCFLGGWGGWAASTCLDLVIRGGPLGFLLRVGRGGGLGEVPSVSEEEISLH